MMLMMLMMMLMMKRCLFFHPLPLSFYSSPCSLEKSERLSSHGRKKKTHHLRGPSQTRPITHSPKPISSTTGRGHTCARICAAHVCDSISARNTPLHSPIYLCVPFPEHIGVGSFAFVHCPFVLNVATFISACRFPSVHQPLPVCHFCYCSCAMAYLPLPIVLTFTPIMAGRDRLAVSIGVCTSR